jgi:hypothetical protein
MSVNFLFFLQFYIFFFVLNDKNEISVEKNGWSCFPYPLGDRGNYGAKA